MKVVLIVIAALVTLGLAAVGVVAAQKGSLSSPPAERVDAGVGDDPVEPRLDLRSPVPPPLAERAVRVHIRFLESVLGVGEVTAEPRGEPVHRGPRVIDDAAKGGEIALLDTRGEEPQVDGHGASMRAS